MSSLGQLYNIFNIKHEVIPYHVQLDDGKLNLEVFTDLNENSVMDQRIKFTFNKYSYILKGMLTENSSDKDIKTNLLLLKNNEVVIEEEAASMMYYEVKSLITDNLPNYLYKSACLAKKAEIDYLNELNVKLMKRVEFNNKLISVLGEKS